MKKRFTYLCLLTLSLCFALSGCFFGDILTNQFEGQGYRPVYITRADLEKIETQPARAMENPGKIYTKGSYLFVNERFEGIHIINNSNPSTPVKISFIKIPGNVDLAAKGDLLYVDNGADLVTLNISNPNSVFLVSRVKKAFPNQEFPPFTNTYFECVDESKGIVVGWELTDLQDPQCYR
jgi:hypothetical protein